MQQADAPYFLGDLILYICALLLPLFFAGLLFFFIHYAKPAKSTLADSGINKKKYAGVIKLIIGNLLILCLLISLFFLAGESYYRFIFDKSEAFGLTRTCHKWSNRHVTYNNLGMRDDFDYSLTSAPGRRRIVFLGDSFTMGAGLKDVNDRFVNIIRRKKSSEWEIHILASGGWDTGQHLQYLKLLRQKDYELDTLVLIYCLNDISDIIPKLQDILGQLYKDVGSEGFLLRHSFMLNNLYYRFKTVFDRDVASYFSLLSDAYADNSQIWQQQKQRLLQLRDFCDKQGIRLLVVTFPFFEKMKNSCPEWKIHEKLGLFWQQIGVPHLDLLEIYKSYEPAKLAVNKYDDHPNKFASSLAADAILRFLQENLSKK